MNNVQEISSHPEHLGIARLVTLAREQGTVDNFHGKRRWKRYAVGMALEVTTDPADSNAAWNVVMHNISGGGFGFWSKRRVRDGQRIFVRSRSRDKDGEWLSAEAAHCVVGIKGYLIGAAFTNPITREATPVEASFAADSPEGPADERRPSAGEAPTATLRAKATLLCGVSILVGSITTAVIAYRVWPQGAFVWLNLLFVAALTGFCLHWGGLVLLMRRETGFIRDFQNALRAMAEGSTGHPALRSAPSAEFDVLRHTLLDLRATWQKRQDADRLQRQKLEELNQIKSNILSIVSHDLRTPMTSILLYARMLDDELESLAVEDQRRFLKIIADECTRLSRLVDDLLEVQRLESGRTQWDLRPSDLTETIRACVNVFEAMAFSKSIELTVDCPDKLPLVEADSDKISQVLSNLLSNALKYTPAGGKVHLEGTANANEITLRVADTGVGIPRDKWDQIFDRFAQLSNRNVREISGVGLGLYIVRQIVERHGGMVWVDSREGQGSDFFVSLPTRSQIPEPETGGDPPASAGRIVVCDADPQLASMIAHTLRLEKYDVRLAHSGCRLLAHLSRGDVDVVVTDLLLPDMNATELLNALNGASPRTFRLIVHSYAGDAPDMRRRGVDIVLTRPATEDELRQAVRLAMQGHSAGGLGIVLVRAPSMDMRRFKQMLADAGHTPIVAESLVRAAEVIRDYPVHLVLVSVDSLHNNWSNLQKLALRHDKNVRVIVLLDRVRRRERHLAGAYGVTAVPYVPGGETQVLQAITRSDKVPVPELST